MDFLDSHGVGMKQALWKMAITIRIAWTIAGQSGYIHPDEFFQSVEVVAGDIMGYHVFRSWEFKEESPVRSTLLPYTVCGLPLLSLKTLSSYLGLPSITGYTLMLLPRLCMVSLSIINDMLILLMTHKLHLDVDSTMLTHAMSCVSLVFYTRTLSNTLEAFLFTALLYVVIQSYEYSLWTQSSEANSKSRVGNKTLKQAKSMPIMVQLSSSSSTSSSLSDCSGSESNSESRFLHAAYSDRDVPQAMENHTRRLAYRSTTTARGDKHPQERLNMRKRSKATTSQTSAYENSTEISLPQFVKYSNVIYSSLSFIVISGFFNRPTFLFYAFIPCIVWIFNVNFQRTYGMLIINSLYHLMQLVPHVFFYVSIFVIFDSLYYRSLDIADILDMNLDKMINYTSYTITPLNFVKYNLNPKNLAEHGIHPRITHALVNFPMLFNVMAYYMVTGAYKCWKVWRQSRVYGFNLYFYLSTFVPLGLLSIFPHQEPRFLIPLLTPVTLLCGAMLFKVGTSKFTKTMWIVSNLLMAVFFGIVHQGGLVPCLKDLNSRIKNVHLEGSRHIVFYHTYMPPRFLLGIHAYDSDILPQKMGPNVIHDLKGAKENVLIKDVLGILSSTHKEIETEIFVLAPATVNLTSFHKDYKSIFFTHLVTRYWPHLSTEDLPNFKALTQQRAHSKNNSTLSLIDILSLNVYKVLRTRTRGRQPKTSVM